MKKLALSLVFCFALSSTAFAATQSIDWSQLGPSFTLLTTPENWTSGAYSGEVGITGSLLGTQNFERLDQGNGWSGNFFPGEALIWNEGNYQQTGIDIGVLFNQNVSGGGAQIQSDYFGPFTATLSAYQCCDADPGNLIGTVVMNGISNANDDGSAIFISFLSNTPNVWFLDFNVVDQFGGDSLAIGSVTLTTTTTPEPSSLMLLGSGLLGLAGVLRRKLKA